MIVSYLALLVFGLQALVTHSETRIHKRIIGGEEVPPDKYRWAVSIKGDVDELKSSGACGATIIKTKGKIQWLITAAHCFYPGSKKIYNLTSPSLWHVRIGLTKVDFLYEKHKNEYQTKGKLVNFFKAAYERLFSSKKTNVTTGDIHIQKIFIHPDYKYTRLEYDIALMKLNDPIPTDDLKGVNAIDLPERISGTAWPPIGSDCILIGWGCTKAKGSPNPIAQLATLKVWQNSKCKWAYLLPIDLNPSSEFCAGYRKKNIGVCPGDSGSGLACEYNGKLVLAGVVSATHSKRPGEYPGLFTRVSTFKTWITDVVENN